MAGFATEEWRAYLSKMNDWYEKGLIDPDFMTDSAFMVDTELVTSEQSGVWYSFYTMPQMYESSVEGIICSRRKVRHWRITGSRERHLNMQTTVPSYLRI